MVRTGKDPGLSKMVREEAKTSLDHWSAELSRIKKSRYEKKDQQYKGHSEYIAIKREVDDVDLRRLRARIFQTAQARFDAAQWQARLELEDEEDVVEQQSPALPTPPVSPMPPPPQSGFEFQTQTQVSFSAAASRNPNPEPKTNNRRLRFVKIGGEEEESDDDETV